MHLAERIADSVRGLVEDAGAKGIARLHNAIVGIGGNADVDDGDAPGSLGVGLDFVEVPAGDVHARFIDRGGIDRASPKQRRGFVSRVVLEEVILAPVHPAARPETVVQRDVEKAECDAVVLGGVVVHLAVMLPGFGVVGKALVLQTH